jgi:hypothetical protein
MYLSKKNVSSYLNRRRHKRSGSVRKVFKHDFPQFSSPVLPDPARLKFGYNSHGGWSTLGAIEMEERDRGNDFPVLNYSADTPAIWICLTSRKALRYLALAESWEHLDDENEPLTRGEREMIKEVTKIKLEPTDRTVFDDGDDGYLLLRPQWRQSRLA